MKRDQETGERTSRDSVGRHLKNALERRKMASLPDQDEAEPSSLMMSPVRREIYSSLSRRPCICLGHLVRLITTSRANASWHIDKLTGSGFLIRKRVGGHWLHFPSGLLEEDVDVPVLATFNDDNTLDVFLKIRKDPGSCQKTIARKMDQSRQRVAWHLKKLRRNGLIEVKKVARYRRYHLTDLFDRRAKENKNRIGAFKGILMRRLKEDGTKPSIVKHLSTSFIVRLGAGREVAVMEITTDPFEELLEGNI